MDPTEADAAYDQGTYVTCKKCGVEHSTLVKHRCFKPKAQKEKPKFDDAEKVDGESGGGGGEGESGESSAENPTEGTGESNGSGEGQGEGEGQGDGQSDGEGEGEGEGSGQGQQGEGEEGQGQQGEDEDEGEGQRQAPEPQMPEPEIPPVIVVVSVLKYAALCAACAKNGNIEITLVEDGLFVYGHNGDTVAVDTIPWGELEQRATRDGQFYVKSVIDGVDGKLVSAREEMIAKIAAIPEGKKPEAKVEIEIEAKAEVEKPALTLPLSLGQIVVQGVSKTQTVVAGFEVNEHHPGLLLARLTNGTVVHANTGLTTDDGVHGPDSLQLGNPEGCDLVSDFGVEAVLSKGGKAKTAKRKK